MKYISLYAIISISVLAFTCCEIIETNPLTKVRTVEVSPEVVTATVSGKIIDLSSSGNIEHGFCYASHSNPTINDNVTALGHASIGEFTASLNNLTPGEQYYVKAFCKDGEKYIYGDALEFSTSAGNVTFESYDLLYISPSNARASVNISDDGGASLTARGVVWSTSENPNIDNNFTSDGEGLGSWESELIELTPTTTYYAKAYATNIAGTFYSNEISFTTLEEGTVYDVEGNQYKTVTIDTSVWMADNLRVTKYNDKTPIATGLNNNNWEADADGAYSIYPYSNIDGLTSEVDAIETYGLLYSWNAVNNQRGLCPVGWRVPTDEDWTQLLDYMATGNSSNMGNQLKSCRQIDSPLGGDCATTDHPRWEMDGNHHGSDDFGFGALPAGLRYSNGTYLGVGTNASFWSSSQLSANNAWYIHLSHSNGEVGKSIENKNMGFSVRCVREW